MLFWMKTPLHLIALIHGSKGYAQGHTLPSFVYLNGGDFIEMVEWS